MKRSVGDVLRLPWLALAGIVAVSSALLAAGTSRVEEWVVMTDELLYAKLAAHMGHTGSPLPVLHGEHVGFLGVVYPILLSPFYGTLDPPGAFEAAHIVNAVLFASAAVPAFLLARRVVPVPCALAVSALAIAIPWSLNAAFVMSEAAAYPVFLWAVLSCHVALAQPSPRRDALAIGGLALAYFTRPQFAFLAVALPLAAVITDGPRRAVARHRLLAAAYAAGLVVVGALAAAGQGHRLLGDYGVTATEGSLLPAIAWKSAALHLDVLAVGLGVVPFLLGAGWAYSRLRTAWPPRRSFAALTASCLPLLALETGSYDVRFGGSDVIRDRYLFYLAPLLLLASALFLLEDRRPLAGLAGATAFFAATVTLADFTPVAGILVDSPEAVLNGAIHDSSPGLPAGVFVALCGLVLGAICFGLTRLPRPAAVTGVAVAIFAFGGSVAGYAYDRLLTSRAPSGIAVTGESRVRDWVDRAANGEAAVVAAPVSTEWGYSAIRWWEVEFWNDAIGDAFVGRNGLFTYTPFPDHPLRLDFRTGRFAGTAAAPPYVVVPEWDPRFALAGVEVARNVGLRLVAADRPYRTLWATRGLEPDGWTRPQRPALVRVYAPPRGTSERVRIALTLGAPIEASGAVRFRLGGVGGSVDPGQLTKPEVERCLPAGRHLDFPLVSEPAATVVGPPLGPEPGPVRTVGVVVAGVQVISDGKPCAP